MKENIYYSTSYLSPVGTITLACNGSSLTGLWIVGQKYYGGMALEKMVEKKDIPVFDIAKKWLDRYFRGEKPDIAEIPMEFCGSEFRKGVWDILREIPYGKLVTYGDIAKQMAVKMHRTTMSAQAVGGAVGHNPISIVVPCHRVVGTNGSLTGYAGGIDMKAKLLKLEGADMSHLLIPKKGTAISSGCP